MGIEIHGFDEFEKKMLDIARRFPEARDKFLKQEAELIKGRAKMNTPVDTGRLRNSWNRTKPAGGSIEIYNNTDYAAHVEYGHRLKNRKTGEWIKDKSGHLKYIKGVKMLHEAMEETSLAIRGDAKRILGGLFE